MLDVIYFIMLVLVIILLNYQVWAKGISVLKALTRNYKESIKSSYSKHGQRAAWVFSKFNNLFMIVSQIIGLIALFATLSKYENKWNGYYSIPLIFIVIIPIIILIVTLVLKKVYKVK